VSAPFGVGEREREGERRGGGLGGEREAERDMPGMLAPVLTGEREAGREYLCMGASLYGLGY